MDVGIMFFYGHPGAVTLLVLCAVSLDAMELSSGGILISWIFGSLFNTFKSEETARVYYLVCVIISLIGQFKLFAMLGLIIIAYDRGLVAPGFQTVIGGLIAILARWITRSIIWFSQLNNNLTLLMSYLGIVYNAMIQSFKSGNRITAVKMRDIGTTDPPRNCSRKPIIPSKRLRDQVKKKIRDGHLVLTLLVCFMTTWYSGYAAAVVGILTFIAHMVIDRSEEKLLVNGNAPMTEDGVYQISTKWYRLTIAYGVGTSVNGILHVPYHVCWAGDILCEKTLATPYYISRSEDLVTYGGPPALVRVRQGDTVLVNCETQSARVTYKVNYDLDDETGNLTWPEVTIPGESGSPILLKVEDKFLLVGLAGTYLKDWDGTHTGLLIRPRDTEKMEAINAVPRAMNTKTIKN